MDKRNVTWDVSTPQSQRRTAVVADDAPADGLVPLAPGTAIGKYQVVAVLGQGAFGITYRARDTRLDRDVAIKEYMPVYFATRQRDHSVLPRSTHLAEDFRWGRERFLAEARTLAQLEKAAGIVNVYDFLEVNGTAYMVMELVSGETLEARLKRERQLPLPATERLLGFLLDGLERVHEAGFLHRDIKPANILLDSTGGATLIDFGASRAALQGRTQAMTAVYTPGYAAFEQFTSARLGPWTDIYALGATLYHCVAGRPPTVASDRMIEDTLVPAVEAAKGRYPPGLLSAIDAALKLKGSDRPQTIAEWRRLLSAAPPPTLAPTVRILPAITTVAGPGGTMRVRRAVWLAAGAMALCVAGGIYVWQRAEDTPMQPSPAGGTTGQGTQADLEAKRQADAAARQAAEERARAEAEARQRDDAARRQAPAQTTHTDPGQQAASATAPQDTPDMHIQRGADYARKGDYDRAIDEYTQAIRLRPDDAGAFYSRGDAYNGKGDYDRAIEDFTQAIALKPDFAMAVNGRGVSWDSKGDYDRAIEAYTQAIRLKPDYAEAFYNRAGAYRRDGRDDLALQDYSEAIRLKPDFAVAFNNRGNVYRAKGQYDRAIADYSDAIRIDPGFTIALKNRADVHVGKGDYDRALEDYSQAITIAPDFAVAYKGRGDVHYRKGQYDRAIPDYSEATRLDPDNAVTWHGLCSARALAGQLEQALADCTESLRLRPGNANTLDSRGFAYLKLGQLDRAIGDYDAALSIDARRPASLYSRGVARLRKGDAAAARADMAAARAIDRSIAAKMRKFGIHP
jgi:tetratricopeptide (TPR) repeat protein/serine/threonine protein kinase